eukprot:scaffold1394_cov109-Isochrysis_galbana.AAC.24
MESASVESSSAAGPPLLTSVASVGGGRSNSPSHKCRCQTTLSWYPTPARGGTRLTAPPTPAATSPAVAAPPVPLRTTRAPRGAGSRSSNQARVCAGAASRRLLPHKSTTMPENAAERVRKAAGSKSASVACPAIDELSRANAATSSASARALRMLCNGHSGGVTRAAPVPGVFRSSKPSS